MATLIWYKYATFRNLKGRPAYKVSLKNISYILQYPRYLFHIAEIFGNIGSSIIDEFLLRGQATADDMVEKQLQIQKGEDPEFDEEIVTTNVRSVFRDMVANS
jgi:hypothetical protein